MRYSLATLAVLAALTAPAFGQEQGYDAQFAAARALVDAGKFAEAVQAYSAMLAKSPNNVDLLYGRALASMRMQRWAEAETDLRAATVAAPTYADVWSSLGSLYQWTDRPQESEQAFARVVALRPADPQARLSHSQALLAAGQRDAARAELEQAVKLGLSADQAESMQARLQPRPTVQDAATLNAIAPEGYTWSAGLSTTQTKVGDNAWNDTTASVRRYFALGSLGFEALHAHRFGLHDAAWALDGYASLWSGAYANVRYQRGPTTRLYPANAWRAELFQGVGGGWEVSAAIDDLGFEDHVHLYTAGLGRYVGNFYVRLRHQHIVSPGSSSNSQRLQVRYYDQGDADNYMELNLSTGRSANQLDLGGGRITSDAASVNVVRYVAHDWALKVGASFARSSGSANEKSLSLGVSRRW